MSSKPDRKHGARLQQVLINYIIDHVGEDTLYGCGRDTKKTGVIKAIIRQWNDKMRPVANFNVVHPSTVYRWIHHYVEYGEVRGTTMERLKGRRSKRRAKWNYERTLWLKLIVDEEPWLYLDEIQAKLLNECGMKFSHSSIHNRLTKHLRYSLCVMAEKAIQRSSQERSQYLEYRKEILQDRPETAIFIDETHNSVQCVTSP